MEDSWWSSHYLCLALALTSPLRSRVGSQCLTSTIFLSYSAEYEFAEEKEGMVQGEDWTSKSLSRLG